MKKRSISRRIASGIRLLTVDVRTQDGMRIRADILDATARGMAVICSHKDAPRLPIGAAVELDVYVGNEEIHFTALVSSSAALNGFERYGFEFQDPNPMAGDVSSPFVRRIFDRRIAQRVPFGPEESVLVSVRAASNAPVIEGRLLDISSTGASLEAFSEEIQDLEATNEVELEFRLPECGQSVRLTATITRLHAEGAGALLSVEFQGSATGSLSLETNLILDFVSRRVIGYRVAA